MAGQSRQLQQDRSLRLLDLLQLADSSFPSGSYAHSFGLEWLQGQPAFDLEAVLRARLSQQLARLELPLLRFAFVAGTVAELLELDRLADTLMPVSELREASRSVGHSFLRAALKLHDNGISTLAAGAGLQHQPVAFGAILQDWDLPLDDGLLSYSLQAVRQQLAAAQRLGRIGQSAAQDLMHRLKPAVVAAVEQSGGIAMNEIGAFTPWLDLAGMCHAQAFARLFRS